MSKVRVSAFAVSLDGYSAGPRQSLDNPLGVRGPELWTISLHCQKSCTESSAASIISGKRFGNRRNPLECPFALR
jgi:hypothetical protein